MLPSFSQQAKYVSQQELGFIPENGRNTAGIDKNKAYRSYRIEINNVGRWTLKYFRMN